MIPGVTYGRKISRAVHFVRKGLVIGLVSHVIRSLLFRYSYIHRLSMTAEKRECATKLANAGYM